MGFRSSHPESCLHAHFQLCGYVSVLLHSAWRMLQHGRHRYVLAASPTPTPTPTPAPTSTPTPAVTTNPATKVAAFSATLNASVNPRGATTIIYCQYGLTTSYRSNTPMQTQNGNTSRAISANISGLLANRTYHFRIVTHNNGGTSFGADRTFTTLTATRLPVVTTNPVTLIASFSATLNGSLNPHGFTTTVYFQYGTTTSYGSTSPMQTQTGNTYRNIAANISGLTPNTVYHFRIVATNGAGTRFGADRTLLRLPPPARRWSQPIQQISSRAFQPDSIPCSIRTA